MNGAEGLYPKTGRYRAQREFIKKHADAVTEEYDRKTEEWRGQVLDPLNHLFHLDKDQIEALTPEERADVRNFIRYGEQRLLNSHLASEQFHKMIEVSGLENHVRAQEGLKAGSLNTHDLLHVLAAYSRSGGTSSNPSFNTLPYAEVYTSPEAHAEELMAQLWEEPIADVPLDTLFSERNPVAYAQERTFKSGHMIEFDDAEAKKWRSRFEAIKKTGGMFGDKRNTVSFYLDLYEFIYFFRRSWSGNFDGLQNAYDTVRRHRHPEYVKVFTTLFENARSKKPNPKILLNEFRRVLSPLLTRLRSGDAV